MSTLQSPSKEFRFLPERVVSACNLNQSTSPLHQLLEEGDISLVEKSPLANVQLSYRLQFYTLLLHRDQNRCKRECNSLEISHFVTTLPLHLYLYKQNEKKRVCKDNSLWKCNGQSDATIFSFICFVCFYILLWPIGAAYLRICTIS